MVSKLYILLFILCDILLKKMFTYDKHRIAIMSSNPVKLSIFFQVGNHQQKKTCRYKISPSEEHKEKQYILRTIGFAKLQSKLGTLFDISVKLWRSEKILYKYASTAIYGLREERQFDVEIFWCCSIYWVDIR